MATWRDEHGQGRCVLARVDVADTRWRQLADVVVCPPQRSLDDTRREMRDALAALPACVVATSSWEQGCVVVVRDIGEFTPHARRALLSPADCAVWCYSWVVAPGWSGIGGSSVSRRVCTCSARGKCASR